MMNVRYKSQYRPSQPERIADNRDRTEAHGSSKEALSFIP